MTTVSTSWFSWWFNSQPTASETTGVADQTASRVYLAELKEKLSNQLRAERAECRLDFNNAEHSRIFNASVLEATANLMSASLEYINAEIAEDTIDVLSLRKILAIREKRRAEDLEQHLQMQTDWLAYQRLTN